MFKNLRSVFLSVALLVASFASNAVISPVIVSPLLTDELPYAQVGEIYQKITSADTRLWEARWWGEASYVWTSTGENVPKSTVDTMKWLRGCPFNLLKLYPINRYDNLNDITTGGWTFDQPVNVVVLHYGSQVGVWVFNNGANTFGIDFMGGKIGMSSLQAFSFPKSGATDMPVVLMIFISVIAVSGIILKLRRS